MTIDHACRVASEMLQLDVTLLSVTPDLLAAHIPDLAWTPVQDWESLDDIEIARRTRLLEVLSHGTLVVITDACFVQGHGAFAVRGDELRNLVEHHSRTQGEAFFNGDVVILSPDSGVIWLFHHEGFFASAAMTHNRPAMS